MTVRHWHSIDCLLAIGLPLVVATVKEQSLFAGSKAGRLAAPGLVPVYTSKDTTSLGGLVPR